LAAKLRKVCLHRRRESLKDRLTWLIFHHLFSFLVKHSGLYWWLIPDWIQGDACRDLSLWFRHFEFL
jgi:hypothetical protein